MLVGSPHTCNLDLRNCTTTVPCSSLRVVKNTNSSGKILLHAAPLLLYPRNINFMATCQVWRLRMRKLHRATSLEMSTRRSPSIRREEKQKTLTGIRRKSCSGTNVMSENYAVLVIFTHLRWYPRKRWFPDCGEIEVYPLPRPE